MKETSVIDLLEISLVNLENHVKVGGCLEILLELNLRGVDDPRHEVAVDGGGEVDQPRPEQLESMLLGSWIHGNV